MGLCDALILKRSFLDFNLAPKKTRRNSPAAVELLLQDLPPVRLKRMNLCPEPYLEQADSHRNEDYMVFYEPDTLCKADNLDEHVMVVNAVVI